MNKTTLILIILLIGVIILAGFIIQSSLKNGSLNNQTNLIQNPKMILTSPSFNPNEKIPPKFTCDGGNINPELHIQNVPESAKSLAMIMDDPDAVSGTFTHWIVWNIDPKTEIIKQESAPPGATEGENDTSREGYIGPCPPDKKPHRYFFKLYALDTLLNLEAGSNKAKLESAMSGHIIEQTELIGIYER